MGSIVLRPKNVLFRAGISVVLLGAWAARAGMVRLGSLLMRAGTQAVWWARDR